METSTGLAGACSAKGVAVGLRCPVCFFPEGEIFLLLLRPLDKHLILLGLDLVEVSNIWAVLTFSVVAQRFVNPGNAFDNAVDVLFHAFINVDAFFL